ncbi:hypothetical protein SARC_02450 [Sphaeroforma arctica JP610]|uniref:ATP-dependent DNA helicase n=1 Tax=Sphaeroforma arctica JP610 TaxID=667725 RepID=A0A0L0GAR6_9EUKA|nr:hypothetical protein SARC_02450 [Sphaeroforma arctica JP610]KNC85358.1 hypothetical protein SARC_02450 [Sphaeroforma arctica JP610]|eukprot:XP_014159260.1 hypothetical protein SARC_02450 [Sphaeroforma arctica JP610]
METGALPNTNRDWNGGKTKEDLEKSNDNHYIDPLPFIRNEEQCAVITAYLEHLLEEQPSELRWCVTGITGTGKNYVMKILHGITMLWTANAMSSIITAPTGAAAGNVGGSTLDRLGKFKRLATEDVSLSKSGNESEFAQQQTLLQNTILLQIDEGFMYGKRLLG